MPRGLSDYDSAVIQGRLWTPEVLRPALWLDAADLSTISVATGVSEWRDKSGNARHASQTTGSLQPGIAASTVNGLNSLSFDGSDDWMQTASSSYAARHYFIAFKSNISSTGFNTFPCLYSARVSPNANRTGASDLTSIIGWDINGNNWQNAAGDSTLAEFNAQPVASLSNWNNFNTGSPPPSPVTNWVIVENLISNTASGTKIFCIGADTFSTTGRCWNMQMGEMLVFGNAMSLPERTDIVGYLSWKWGIPLAADHPYANRPPLIGD
jgi:hypothetical protein